MEEPRQKREGIGIGCPALQTGAPGKSACRFALAIGVGLEPLLKERVAAAASRTGSA